jgi:hypothetical protein
MDARQFAIALTDNGKRELVALDEKPKTFGRIRVYVDVCLFHERVAKKLFTVRWNPQQQRHEIQVLGATYPPSLNGAELESEECRLLAVGDIIEIGPFKMEYRDVLSRSSPAP